MRANWAHVNLYTKTEFNWVKCWCHNDIHCISWLATRNLHSFTQILTHHSQTIHNTRKSNAHVYYILIAVVNYCILCHIHNIMYSCCCCYCGRTCIYPTTLLSSACCQYVSNQYIDNAQNICCWARRMSFIHLFMHLYRKVLLSM